MRSIKAVFIKHVLDIFKNRVVLIQFAVFPIIAFIMTELVAKADETIPDSMFVTMFAAIFAGMILLTTTAGVIAEDKEHKSLRFLIIAGVKPYEYLLGMGGVLLSASLLVSCVFALMGGFVGREFLLFLLVMIFGSAASMLLGASIGILSKNQQAAIAISMPIAMVLGFCPIFTMFNETAKKIFSIFYTQQMSAVVSDFSTDIIIPIIIILSNIAVLTVLFTLVYKKKGLKSL
jgi:ABC-2 type transport system permease protein